MTKPLNQIQHASGSSNSSLLSGMTEGSHNSSLAMEEQVSRLSSDNNYGSQGEEAVPSLLRHSEAANRKPRTLSDLVESLNFGTKRKKIKKAVRKTLGRQLDRESEINERPPRLCPGKPESCLQSPPNEELLALSLPSKSSSTSSTMPVPPASSPQWTSAQTVELLNLLKIHGPDFSLIAVLTNRTRIQVKRKYKWMEKMKPQLLESVWESAKHTN